MLLQLSNPRFTPTKQGNEFSVKSRAVSDSSLSQYGVSYEMSFISKKSPQNVVQSLQSRIPRPKRRRHLDETFV